MVQCAFTCGFVFHNIYNLLFNPAVYLAPLKILAFNMEYSKIISVTGLAGLFELVGSKTDGAIVRSLDDKTVRFISSRQHNFSHLESVEVYTVGDNVNLADIFIAMKASGEALPNEKDPKAVKAYFEKVYGDLDFDRVYASDMKKMVKWFSILTAAEVDIKLREEEAEEEEESVEVEEAEVAPQPVAAEAAAPKKKANKKAE